MTKTERRPVVAIIDQTESYPFSPAEQASGISVINTGTIAAVVVINTGEYSVSVSVPVSGTYDADFRAVKSVNVTAGDEYQIEIRGL